MMDQIERCKKEIARSFNDLGLAYQSIDDTKKALIYYKQALTWANIATIHRHISIACPSLEHAKEIEWYLGSEQDDQSVMEYRFALANIYHSFDITDEAFKNIEIANGLAWGLHPYSIDNNRAFVDAIIGAFPEEYLSKGLFGSDSEQPVFVVGLPRSGTTLVEQILDRHTQISGAGELPHIMGVVKGLPPFPDNKALHNHAVLSGVANLYLEKISCSSARVIDKMPGNFMVLGLIRTLFPKARIIHCHRNKNDNFWSLYFSYFPFGNYYANNRQAIMSFNESYEKLMRYWKGLYPDILDVEYESLVTNTETVSKQMVEYLGLEWEPSCLDTNDNHRRIITSSNDQVRKPVYTSAIGKWEKYNQYGSWTTHA